MCVATNVAWRRLVRRAALGEQELELLRFVAEHAPISVGEVADGYGSSTGLARTTLKTMMERLQKKGYLARSQQGGVFRYECSIKKTDLLQGLVSHFVEKTLAGSLSPFVTYLANGKDLSDQEFAELEQLVEQLGARRKEQEP
jgi:predicted transcriptional regulator